MAKLRFHFFSKIFRVKAIDKQIVVSRKKKNINKKKQLTMVTALNNKLTERKLNYTHKISNY